MRLNYIRRGKRRYRLNRVNWEQKLEREFPVKQWLVITVLVLLPLFFFG